MTSAEPAAGHCPNCGTRITTADRAPDDATRAATETTRCRECGLDVWRRVGEAWQRDER